MWSNTSWELNALECLICIYYVTTTLKAKADDKVMRLRRHRQITTRGGTCVIITRYIILLQQKCICDQAVLRTRLMWTDLAVASRVNGNNFATATTDHQHTFNAFSQYLDVFHVCESACQGRYIGDKTTAKSVTSKTTLVGLNYIHQ